MHPADVDPVLFERQFVAFADFVRKKSGDEAASFSNRYVAEQEGYKLQVAEEAKRRLQLSKWRQSQIGSGKISEDVIGAVEIDGNNLVQWRPIYGEEKRPHQVLYRAQIRKQTKKQVEQVLFDHFKSNQTARSFESLVDVFGKSYSIIAYLFFIKDPHKFLPIAPSYFDRAFEHLGVDLKMSLQCSWENYRRFLQVMYEIQELLAKRMMQSISLLDAHSFAWILACQMHNEHRLPEVDDWKSLPETERKSIIQARIGQGLFRSRLISQWGGCAVTNCTEPELLRASHIKPWKDSDNSERLNPYNGLLLNPTIDACFDRGYVSFDANGRILISASLSPKDTKALGLSTAMKLRDLSKKHLPFLEYHRDVRFQSDA